MLTFPEVLAAHARSFEEKPCILLPDGTAKLTYGSLDRAASSFASFLAEQGCGPQAKLLVAINNSAEFFVALIGAMRARVVAVPVDANLTSAELCSIVQHADPQIFVVDRTSESKLADIARRFDRLVVSEDLLSDMATTGQVHRGDSTKPLPAFPPPDELSLILYTSGTTGTKG